MYIAVAIAYLLLNSNPNVASEPACSRYHFVEQTLEKMIRQEILVEKMKAEIDDTKQQVLDTLADIKTERNKLAVAIDRMENENRIKLQEFSTEMERIKVSAVTPSVAFKAHKITERNLEDNKVMIFSETILAIGHAYNNQTGIFVAPVDGIYHFSAQICVGSDDWVYFGILLEEKLISSIADGDKLDGCFTFDAIAAVEAGQRVSVQCTHGCSGDSLWEAGEYATNSFAGILVHK